MKLLILDRDGVINEDSDAYIKSLDEWLPIPSSIAAIARLSRAGWTGPDAEVERRASDGWPPRATERRRATSDTITATDKVRGGKYLTLYYS